MSALEIYVYVRVNHKKYVKIFLCKWWRGNERISLLCDGVNYVLAASCCNCQRNNVAALRAAKTFGCVEISWQLPTGSRAKICIPNKTEWDGWQAPGKNVNLVHDALTTTTRLLCRYISQSASESESNPAGLLVIKRSSRRLDISICRPRGDERVDSRSQRHQCTWRNFIELY